MDLTKQLILITCLLGFACGCQAAGITTARPNIVLILADDLGYSDVGFNGATDIRTPELDRLAKNGMVSSSAYVTHPFCGLCTFDLLGRRAKAPSPFSKNCFCQL